MVRYGRSMELAGEVIANLFYDSRLDKLNILIEAYQNGWEQGYSIYHHNGQYPLYFYIAKAHGTENIVVYKSDKSSLQGLPDDNETYKSARYFDTVNGASEYIVKLVRRNVLT